MRQTFPQHMPWHDQLLRIPTCHTGRKHQHRIGPGKLKQRQVSAMNHKNMMKRKMASKYSAKVRAYWLGLRDSHP